RRRQSGRLEGLSRTDVHPDSRVSAATAAAAVPARVRCCCADCGGPRSLPPRWIPARSPEEGGPTVTDRAAAIAPAATRRKRLGIRLRDKGVSAMPHDGQRNRRVMFLLRLPIPRSRPTTFGRSVTPFRLALATFEHVGFRDRVIEQRLLD